jgi:V/A-type H+-transporting ATPase subunit I
MPMKKYTFLIFYKEYLEFLQKIQDLGVLHVIEKASGEFVNQELNDQYKQISEISLVIKSLRKRNVEISKTLAGERDGLKILHDILVETDELEQLTQQLAGLGKERTIMEPWNYFEWETISRLAKIGIQIRFFTSSLKKFNEIKNTDIHVELINHFGGTAYFILIEDKIEKQYLDADEVFLPTKTLRQIQEEELKLKAAIDQINIHLDEYAKHSISVLEDTRSELIGKISFQKVVLNTQKEASDRLMILEGWVPVDKKEEVDQLLINEAVYFEVTDPVLSDKVPIKLKNSRFVKLFQPIADLYALPNYFELDLTPLFVPFFMLFFGLCLGDSGYGLIVLLVATIAKIRLKNSSLKPFMTLGQWLGFSTILMGLVSGTVFGMNLLNTGYLITNESLAYLKNYGVPADIRDKISTLVGEHFHLRIDYFKALINQIGEPGLKEYRREFIRCAFSDVKVLNYFRHLMLDSNQMFLLAIILGLIQIFFGLCVKAFNLVYHKGFKYSLSTFGWIILFAGIAAGYFLAQKNMIPPELKSVLFYSLLGISGFLILVFSDPDSNPIISSLKGIWNVYGMVSGVFGDTLSYIRLFALGTSGAILGLVVNSIAIQILHIQYLGPVLFIIFLLFGHGLTIALSVLGAFVHPMRLTFVEFYKNAGFTGGGKAYKPFN